MRVGGFVCCTCQACFTCWFYCLLLAAVYKSEYEVGIYGGGMPHGTPAEEEVSKIFVYELQNDLQPTHTIRVSTCHKGNNYSCKCVCVCVSIHGSSISYCLPLNNQFGNSIRFLSLNLFSTACCCCCYCYFC